MISGKISRVKIYLLKYVTIENLQSQHCQKKDQKKAKKILNS